MSLSQHKHYGGSAEHSSAGRFVANKVGERDRKYKYFRHFGKKGFSWGQFIFSSFCIAVFLTAFYLWVGHTIKARNVQQGDIVSSEVELRIFFSDLVRTHGIEIATKSAYEVEEIIQPYAESYASIARGDADAICTTKGIDKECTLEITTHETLSTLAVVSFFIPVVDFVTVPVYVVMKMLALDILEESMQEAYLPTKDGKAMAFLLTTTVEFA